MNDYDNLLRYILENGEKREDRTGTGTLSIFSAKMQFNLSKGFPAVTKKRLYFAGVVEELLWFLKGDSNVEYLKSKGVNIWNDWANANGDLGRIYGVQWRSWRNGNLTIDQIMEVIESIKNNPNSRRHIVSAWNVGELDEMALPPCHLLFQFYVRENQYLDLQLYQRSADMFLGVPFNIASYSLLLSMIAQVCNLKAGVFYHVIGDAHIYKDHQNAVNQYLSNEEHKLPTLWLNPTIRNIDNFRSEHINLVNYKHSGKISAAISV